MNRILVFLDFDGVLNSDRNYRKLQMAGLATTDAYGTLFDQKCVRHLTNIIAITKADIVVMSSWRYIHNVDTLRKMWAERSLPGDIVDITPVDFIEDAFDVLTRGKEVEEWFRRNGIDDTACRYVLLDDENEFLPQQQKHLVWNNPECGLSIKDVEKAIKIIMDSDSSNK